MIAFAPLLFFHFLHVVNEVQDKLTGTHAGSEDHPPAQDRRMRLKRYLEEQSINGWKEYYALVEHVFSCIRGTDVGDLMQ
jgi:hypothetical protein